MVECAITIEHWHCYWREKNWMARYFCPTLPPHFRLPLYPSSSSVTKISMHRWSHPTKKKKKFTHYIMHTIDMFTLAHSKLSSSNHHTMPTFGFEVNFWPRIDSKQRTMDDHRWPCEHVIMWRCNNLTIDMTTFLYPSSFAYRTVHFKSLSLPKDLEASSCFGPFSRST